MGEKIIKKIADSFTAGRKKGEKMNMIIMCHKLSQIDNMIDSRSNTDIIHLRFYNDAAFVYNFKSM